MVDFSDIELVDLTHMESEEDMQETPTKKMLNSPLMGRENATTPGDSNIDHQNTHTQRRTLFQKKIRDWVLFASPESAYNENSSERSSPNSPEILKFLSTPTRKKSVETSLMTPVSCRSLPPRRLIETKLSEGTFEEQIPVQEQPLRATSPTPVPRRQTQTRQPIVKFDSKLHRVGPVPDYCYKKDAHPPTRVTKNSYAKSWPGRRQLRSQNTGAPVEITRLGYRGFSNKSQGFNSSDGFKAGAFMGMDAPPECPGIRDPVYISEALRHVGLSKDAPTPFISLTKNPIRAITRAFRLGRTSPGFLAIIDMDALQQRTNVQAAGNLGLNPPNVHYDAGGEFLVWGFIPKRAILSVIPVDELCMKRPYTSYDEDILAVKVIQASWRSWFIRQALYKKNFQFDYELGVAIGAFVRTWNIQPSHFEAAVDDVTRDWIVKRRGIQHWKLMGEFAAGALVGYENGQLDEERPRLDESIDTPSTPPPSSTLSRALSPQPGERRPRPDDSIYPTFIPPSFFSWSPTLLQQPEREQLRLDHSTNAPSILLPSSSQSSSMSPELKDFSSLPFFYEGEMNCFEAKLRDPFTHLPSIYENEM